MSTLLRRVRGVVGCALTWAVSWAVLGSVFRVVWPLEAGLGTPTIRMIVGSGVEFVIPGALAGAQFALLLALGRRSRIEDYSTLRVVLSAAMAAVALPSVGLIIASIVSGQSRLGVWPMIAQYAVCGALCASGSFLLAKRPTPPLHRGLKSQPVSVRQTS